MSGIVRSTIEADALKIRAVASDLEKLKFSAPAEGNADLEAIGQAYLATSVRLERMAAVAKERGAAYLGL